MSGAAPTELTTAALAKDGVNTSSALTAKPHDEESVTSVQQATPAAKMTVKKRILGIIWDSLDKSPVERKFIHKTDCWIMSYVCVAYFVKYLDQTNVVNAYVSGMKEDLDMAGNNYNMLITMFTVGYCLGNLPSQLMMTRIRPSIWLPTLELLWGFLVMSMAAAKNVETLYVLRFFIGLLEASAYPGILTLLGNWYTPQELGKRSSIFIASAFISQMFSGYLQAALYHGMDGKHGLRAWQWLFIFDGIIGIPVCIFGYFAVPDSPANTKAKWLKPEEKELAVHRMEAVGRKPPKKLSWKIFGEIFTMWPVYLFSIIFAAQLLGVRITNYFTIYLKDTGKFSVEEVNVIPTAGFAFTTVLCLIYAWLSDGIGLREPSIVIAASISMIGCIILSVYPDHSFTAMMAGWIMTFGQAGASALIMAYLNELLSFSTEHRLVVIGIVETFGFSMNAWGILVAYPSGEAPRFKYGYQLASMFFAIEIVTILAIAYLARKHKPRLRS